MKDDLRFAIIYGIVIGVLIIIAGFTYSGYRVYQINQEMQKIQQESDDIMSKFSQDDYQDDL